MRNETYELWGHTITVTPDDAMGFRAWADGNKNNWARDTTAYRAIGKLIAMLAYQQQKSAARKMLGQ